MMMFKQMNQKEIIPKGVNLELEERISKKLEDFISSLIFKKIEKHLGELSVDNAKKTELQKALERGDITFHNGEFFGKYNSKLTKELRSLGAKKSGKVFKIHKVDVPDKYISSIEKSNERFKKDIDKIDKLLKEALSEVDNKDLQIKTLVNDAIVEMDSDATKKMESIGIKVDLDFIQFDNIVRTYVNNFDRDIKSFANEEIESMRQEIQELYLKGQRSKSLVDFIQKRKSVSLSRAKFIASQETQLMSASFQREKFKSGGSKEYRWKCVAGSANHPVRPDHKRLDNQIFQWDNPPITNLSTGARNNPREDFRCRCIAIPIFN